VPANLVFILLFFAIAAYGQQTSVAVLPSEGATGNDELEALTDEMREAALKVLPTSTFTLLKQDVVVKRLGGAENYIKKCKESSCIVDLGKQAQVDYVAQASVRKLGNKIRLKVELYNVRTEGLVDMFNDEADNVRGLLAIVKKKAPEVFGKIPGASRKVSSPYIPGGISGLEKAVDYELDERLYLVNLSTEPPGAVLSFDGMPSAKCPKTPCKLELHEGSVRIIANLEQYEIADTTVSINQNNQGIAIRLKPNFGILEIKPAYLDEIGKDIQWSLSINDSSYSLGEIRLSPNKYTVRLGHECYENIGFEVGINKDSREVFDMTGNITLKKGGLILSAERNGEPVSELVFMNGKQAGETPFSGAVPLCAKVEIGDGREALDVKLKYNDKTSYVYIYRSDFNVPKPVVEPYIPTPDIGKPIKTNFWGALVLDVLGAAIIYAGYAKHKEMWAAYDEYNMSGQSQSYYRDTWSSVTYKHNERNIFYAIGGTFLALGLGVHIRITDIW